MNNKELTKEERAKLWKEYRRKEKEMQEAAEENERRRRADSDREERGYRFPPSIHSLNH